MPRNRVDQLAPPPKRPDVPAWVQVLALTTAGAILGSLCPFIDVPPLRAVCEAVAGVVKATPAQPAK